MVLDSELIDAIRRPSAADESEQATDERVASAVASLFAKSGPPEQPWSHSDAIAEAIDHGLAATTRALLGCGATAGDDALHRAAALTDAAAAARCIAVLVEAGLPLDGHESGPHHETPLESARTVEAATLLAKEGATVRHELCAAHAVAGRVDIADALAASHAAPSITVRPLAEHRAYWTHAALSALDQQSSEAGMLRDESEKLVTISSQLSARLREKGRECDKLIAANEKLQQQLCAESREAKASAPAAATKDDTVYLDAEGEGAADQSEEIAALHITIAALRSEVEESRSRGQDDALDISAVRKTAAAEASAVAEARIEELEREVIQLRGAAADAVGQLHKATNAVTTQRNRAHAADDALAEVQADHRHTKAEVRTLILSLCVRCLTRAWDGSWRLRRRRWLRCRLRTLGSSRNCSSSPPRQPTSKQRRTPSPPPPRPRRSHRQSPGRLPPAARRCCGACKRSCRPRRTRRSSRC